MSGFEQMEMKLQLLHRLRLDLNASMTRTEESWKGRTLGFKIPEDIRKRLEVQAEVYGIPSNKKTVQTAMLLGLTQMEYLATFRAPEPKKPPVESVRLPDPKMFPPELEAEINDDKDSTQEVPEVLGSDDQGRGNSGDSEWSDRDLSRS